MKILFRHLLRRKLLSLLNIVGLGIGLASVLLLALYVRDEWAVDRHHPDAGSKYRLQSILNTGTEVLNIENTSGNLAGLLTQNFPDIVASTRYFQSRQVLGSEGDEQPAFVERMAFADPNLVQFFSFDWLQGNPETALADPASIVLTQSLARRFFGDQNPIGRTLQLEQRTSLRVSGVIADPQQRTHLDFEALVPMPVLRSMWDEAFFENWFNIGFISYLQLAPDANMETAWPAMVQFLEATMPEAPRRLVQPTYRALKELHLQEQLNPGTARTRLDDVLVLVGISIAILLVACINFINLATARSTERVMEIALRKVAGASRSSLFVQHMGESGVMVLLALLLALGLAELALPLVNSFTGKTLDLWSVAGNWWLIALVGVVVALLAGVYPALYLSGFRPLRIMRQRQVELAGFWSLRNVLVMFQFAIAIAALIASSVIVLQLRFVQQRELGFDGNSVLVIENGEQRDWPLLKQRILEQGSIKAASAATSRPFMSIASSAPVRYEGMEAEVENLSGFQVDLGYFELFEVKTLAGRVFSPDVARDRETPVSEDNPHPAGSVVLNAAMVQRLGWTPEQALGKRFELERSGGTNFERSLVADVIGVVDNLYVDSAQREVVPLFYHVPPESSPHDYLFFKLDPARFTEQQALVESAWREVHPDRPLVMYPLESKREALYQREQRQAALLGLFAGLAILVSCMGLIGLAAYATERRVKEVGVRKTIGASVLQIVMLFSVEFSKLVLVANVIAWPLAYAGMQQWLENFAYRIELTPLVFVGSGLIALCVAWVTVGSTTAKAASAKPVLALRYE